MDVLDSPVGRLTRVPYAAVAEQARALWAASFKEDGPAFARSYFDVYLPHVESHFFVNGDTELVLMAFNTVEGYRGGSATLIEGIAIPAPYQGKGVMSHFMDLWLKELDAKYDHVFIQAYNWDIYKRWHFGDYVVNDLYAFTPDGPAVNQPLAREYVNPYQTDAQRSPDHLRDYHETMVRAGDVKPLSFGSASLYLGGDYAVNVVFGKEADLVGLLAAIGKPTTFLYPVGHKFADSRFSVIKKSIVETKLLDYAGPLGRYSFLY